MSELYGIDNIKKILALLIKLGMIGDEIGREGHSWSRFFKITQALPESVELLKVNFAVLVKELKELSATERAEIEVFIKEKLELPSESLELVIESALGILLELGELVEKFLELLKGLKK